MNWLAGTRSFLHNSQPNQWSLICNSSHRLVKIYHVQNEQDFWTKFETNFSRQSCLSRRLSKNQEKAGRAGVPPIILARRVVCTLMFT